MKIVYIEIILSYSVVCTRIASGTQGTTDLDVFQFSFLKLLLAVSATNRFDFIVMMC